MPYAITDPELGEVLLVANKPGSERAASACQEFGELLKRDWDKDLVKEDPNLSIPEKGRSSSVALLFKFLLRK